LRGCPNASNYSHSAPSQRFEIGDQVILEPDLEGTIVGIRYGEPSYDVQVSGICLHNVPPDQLRLVSH
jgi:hypothetical protein